MKDKQKKRYICAGFSFGPNNEHLLGVVGDVHSLDEWLEIAYPGKEAAAYFDGYSDKEICDYILENSHIRLEALSQRH